MEGLELIAFQIISHAGQAKMLCMKAIDLAEENCFDEAEKTLKEVDEYLKKAHQTHFQLIQDEANGQKADFSLILMHAEDQLMTVEMLKELSFRIINIHKKI